MALHIDGEKQKINKKAELEDFELPEDNKKILNEEDFVAALSEEKEYKKSLTAETPKNKEEKSKIRRRNEKNIPT